MTEVAKYLALVTSVRRLTLRSVSIKVATKEQVRTKPMRTKLYSVQACAQVKHVDKRVVSTSYRRREVPTTTTRSFSTIWRTRYRTSLHTIWRSSPQWCSSTNLITAQRSILRHTKCR